LTTKGLIVGWDYVGIAVPQTDPSASLSVLPDRDLNDLEGEYVEIMMGYSWSSSPEKQEYVRAVRAYLTIGQSLWALTLGFAAGLLAAVLYWRQRRRDEAAASA
jgi:hypothetical protein